MDVAARKLVCAPAGKAFGDHELLEFVGGGMSAVYKARHHARSESVGFQHGFIGTGDGVHGSLRRRGVAC